MSTRRFPTDGESSTQLLLEAYDHRAARAGMAGSSVVSLLPLVGEA